MREVVKQEQMKEKENDQTLEQQLLALAIRNNFRKCAPGDFPVIRSTSYNGGQARSEPCDNEQPIASALR